MGGVSPWVTAGCSLRNKEFPHPAHHSSAIPQVMVKPEKVKPMISTSKFYLAVGMLFSFAAVVAIEEIRLAAAFEETAKIKTELADFKLNVETLQRDALEKAAMETQRRLNTQKEIINAKQQTIERLRADFNSATAASERLHKRIEQLTRNTTNQPTGNPTPTGISKTKSSTERIGNLATVVDETAGTLAKELDDAIARGKACEKLYSSLTE